MSGKKGRTGTGEGSKGTRFKTATNCNSCGISLTVDNKKNGKCLECHKKRMVENVQSYNSRHPDRLKETRKLSERRRVVTPERKALSTRLKKKWILENYEHNKMSHSIRQSRRRARIAGLEGEFTADDWKLQQEIFDYRCAYCLIKCDNLVKEHVIPVTKGGRHDTSNIVPACSHCNAIKYNRGPLAMLNLRTHR